MVRHTIRLAADNHQFALATSRTGETASSTDSASIWCEPALSKQRSGSPATEAISPPPFALPAHIVHKPKRFKKAKPPKPSLNSDWAGITVMSDGWSPTDARLAAKYVDRDVTIEVAADGVPLFAGQWGFQAHSDGQPVHPIADWEQSVGNREKNTTSWNSASSFLPGLPLERQIVFGRADRVLYLAEMLIADDAVPPRLQFSSQLPLAHGATWNAESETRDGTIIAAGKPPPSCPSACSEWRIRPRSGAIYSENEWPTHAHARNARPSHLLPAPHRSRQRAIHERTHLATAHRRRELGNRSARCCRRLSRPIRRRPVARLPFVRPPGNRTVLGHNFAGEFSAGRFLTTANSKSGSKSKRSDATIYLPSSRTARRLTALPGVLGLKLDPCRSPRISTVSKNESPARPNPPAATE